ncbi:MAG: methyltransferase domain-containing protein [Bacteroidia bacterium]
MHKNDWNPEMYLKFDKERIQPSIDLVAQIDYIKPSKIIDIGCGPGNSTQILHQRWPDSTILGSDKSPSMIKKATSDYPNQKWMLFDAENDLIEDKYDIVFSNAVIQWIPNHDRLLKNFSNLLNSHGVLAVQLPLFFDMPLGKLIAEVAEQPKWDATTVGVKELFTINNASYYYEQLATYFSEINIWTTNYYHVVESQSAILDMIRSTGLKPYLERIQLNTEKLEFEAQVLDKIKRDYPLQKNGKVLLPFKRLFFVAKK